MFSSLSLHSLCPCSSRPLVRRRPGRAGSRSTPSRLIRASRKWSRAHLTSISPTDTAASTSRRAASLRLRAKGKLIERPAGMTLDDPTPPPSCHTLRPLISDSSWPWWTAARAFPSWACPSSTAAAQQPACTWRPTRRPPRGRSRRPWFQ